MPFLNVGKTFAIPENRLDKGCFIVKEIWQFSSCKKVTTVSGEPASSGKVGGGQLIQLDPGFSAQPS